MFSSHLKRCAFWTALLAALNIRPGIAQTEGPCPPVVIPPIPTSPAPPDAVDIVADSVEVRDSVSIFRGNVRVIYGTQVIYADVVRYDRERDEIQAQGDVRVQNIAGDALETEYFQVQRETAVGFTDAVTFRFGAGVARGDARRILFRGRELVELERARYTRCPAGQDDWFVVARDLELDYARGVGTAVNARIDFKSVPIFYWPYLSFPLGDERKSGFLTPRFGSGDKTGFFIEVPYYLNIAPNLDATITPRHLNLRGLQWLGETRYLGRDYNGAVNVEYLPDDEVYGDDRYAATYRHNHFFSPLWVGEANLNEVSDPDYLSDFGISIADAAVTHIPQKLELRYSGPTWRGFGRVFEYQTLDRTLGLEGVPYSRLPELFAYADLPARANRPHYALSSEFVNFEHDTRVSGQRLDLYPTVSLPLRTSYAFLVPKAGLRYTAYNLDQADGGTNTNPSRLIETFSVDSGLIFEREARFLGLTHTQTLEPRLFYVYVPYEDQDELPVFDTGPQDFNYSNLFRENRFFGPDRIGDANRVTAALTTRMLDPLGMEWLRASLGQVYYFEGERVNLPSSTIERDQSFVVAQTRVRLVQPWYLRNDLQWDQDESKTRNSSTYLQYHPSPDRIVNLGHHYVSEALGLAAGVVQEQVELSSQWRVGRRWSVLAQTNYSLVTDSNIESYFGFEYDACCWRARVYMQRRLDEAETQNNFFYVQFELTGLATLGVAPVASPLTKGAFMFRD